MSNTLSGFYKYIQFIVNEDSIKECDYWIIYEGLQKEETALFRKDNVVLITREPPIIKKYNKKKYNYKKILVKISQATAKEKINN